MCDDGFGPRVVDLLSLTVMPENVELRDFGTAGLTIATELDGFELAVFLDSMDMDGEPGRLIQTEVKVEDGVEDMAELARVTLHEVGLEGLLRFSKAVNTLPPKVVLVGCKPKILRPGLELSPEVEGATHKAVEIVLDILKHHSSEK